MKEILLFGCLHIFTICKIIPFVCSQPENKYDFCQQKSTSGRDYKGTVNTTIDGIPCQKWSEKQPHDHRFTHAGDHNFCRNPKGTSQSQVWCFTSDPEHERQNCSVPFCPPLKALDFSLDNDRKPDENNSYTHASLQKRNFPPSFTICTAFMVEAWAKKASAKLLLLLDGKGDIWLSIRIYAAAMTYTEFSFEFEASPRISNQSKVLFYPLQWTRICLSKSDASIARLVEDGELILEQEIEVKSKPVNLNLVLGIWKSSNTGDQHEYPGQTTDLNIFSSALTVDQMKSQTSPGFEECGLAGDFLSWEKSLEEEQWTLHSKARWIDLDGGLEGPCRAKTNMNVFPMKEGHDQSDCMKHCEKLGGWSPSVKTKSDWENILKGTKAVSPDPSKLPKKIWLSATE